MVWYLIFKINLTSTFWVCSMDCCKLQLENSSRCHSEIDIALKIAIGKVEDYLRCYFWYHEVDWYELPTAALFVHSSAITADLNMSLFELDVGWNPI